MQDFHYNNIQNKYCGKAETLFTDTDSFMCKFETENVSEVFCKNSCLTSAIIKNNQIIMIIQKTQS